MTKTTGATDHLRSVLPQSRLCGGTTTDGPITMHLSRDFSEFIAFLFDRNVRFLVVGGYAVAAHGHPRYTGDLDVWIAIDAANVHSLLRALDDFGFGSLGLTDADFLSPGRVVQLGYPPLRIDLLTSVDGVAFAECYDRRADVTLDGQRVPFIGLSDLRRNKSAAGRPQDIADLHALED